MKKETKKESKEVGISEYHICFKDDDSAHENKFRKLFFEIIKEDNVLDFGHGYGEAINDDNVSSDFGINSTDTSKGLQFIVLNYLKKSEISKGRGKIKLVDFVEFLKTSSMLKSRADEIDGIIESMKLKGDIFFPKKGFISCL